MRRRIAAQASGSLAAKYGFLSQPEINSSFERLREMFEDELLIRTSHSYEQIRLDHKRRFLLQDFFWHKSNIFMVAKLPVALV